MSLHSTLRIDSLSLRNFRCFSECSVEFHPELTVLVASNGNGKTAILDAVAIALGLFVDTVAGFKQYTAGFDASDVRRARGPDGAMLAATPTEFKASGYADGQQVRWQRSRKDDLPRSQTSTRDAAKLKAIALGLRGRLEDFAARERDLPPPLPLVAFYGTGRLWSEHRLTQEKRSPDSSILDRTSGYLDCLSPSSSFKAFVAWYEKTSDEVRSSRTSGPKRLDRPENLIAAVEAATRTALEPTGWHGLRWDFALNQVLIEHPSRGLLPLSFLSDGVRNMIALVADLAHRCVRLNPHFGVEAARLTPGVLLIDEVDMHLHPAWQQQVIELLRKAFPAMQMILSTHSPQVLSTVNADSIRLLRLSDGLGTLETPRFQTRGVESADVLANIMGVDPVPQVEEARWLSQYRALIEDGQVEQPIALSLRDKLNEHFGPQHPVMLDCDRLLRFQAFRRKAQGPQREG